MHHKRYPRWSLVFLTGLLLVVTHPTYSVDNTNRAAQLQKLRARIQTLQENLNETRGRRNTVREELRQIERSIGELLHYLRSIDAQLRANEKILGSLEAQAAHARHDLQEQRQELMRQLRAAYAMGQQDYLKMVLNLENPATLARVLTYYDYLNRARATRIDSTKTTLLQVNALEQSIGERRRELSAQREAQEQQKQALDISRVRRGEILAKLNREMHGQVNEIERLRADENRLERLLTQLKTALPELPPLHGSSARIANFRGRLPLPVKGRIVARYGTQKNIGQLKWRGIFVAGREGQDVISVFGGRVAYADWLHGFGLLLILEHGDGYMTLYGHNQSLHKAVGNWVEAGTVIASLGNTGDAPQPGLYFEIRHHGEPRDPLHWCRAR